MERSNSLPTVHQAPPPLPPRSPRNVGIFRRRRSEETSGLQEANLQTPLVQTDNPMKPMLAQMLRKTKSKALANMPTFQTAFIPPPLRDFDNRLREEPEVLARFLLWYLYHDLYDCPDSPEEWYSQLPFAEVKDWMRMSDFIRQHPDDDLPGLRSVCSYCVIPLASTRDVIARYGQRERMAWTEVMEIQTWGRENRKSDLEITTAIEELLLNDRIVCDGLTRINELDSYWHEAQLKVIHRIDGYLMEIIFPYLQMAKKEKSKDLRRWLADQNNLEKRADTHFYWNEVHRRRRTPSLAYSGSGDVPQFPNPFSRKSSIASVARLDPLVEDLMTPPASSSSRSAVSGKNSDEEKDPKQVEDAGSKTPTTLAGTLPARMDSVTEDQPLALTVDDKVHVSPRTAFTSLGLSPLEEAQKSAQTYSRKYKAIKDYYRALEKKLKDIESDNYWLRKKLAAAEDEVSRYRNGDKDAGAYHITGETLPYPRTQKNESETENDLRCFITGSQFPPHNDKIERPGRTARAASVS